jgi:hypothetical protein
MTQLKATIIKGSRWLARSPGLPTFRSRNTYGKRSIIRRS